MKKIIDPVFEAERIVEAYISGKNEYFGRNLMHRRRWGGAFRISAGVGVTVALALLFFL